MWQQKTIGFVFCHEGKLKMDIQMMIMIIITSSLDQCSQIRKNIDKLIAVATFQMLHHSNSWSKLIKSKVDWLAVVTRGVPRCQWRMINQGLDPKPIGINSVSVDLNIHEFGIPPPNKETFPNWILWRKSFHYYLYVNLASLVWKEDVHVVFRSAAERRNPLPKHRSNASAPIARWEGFSGAPNVCCFFFGFTLELFSVKKCPQWSLKIVYISYPFWKNNRSMSL